MRRRLLSVCSTMLLLSCVAMLFLCVRWAFFEVIDEAYIHLPRTTVRIEIEPQNRRIVIGRFVPHRADAERPLIALYPGHGYGANRSEHYGAFGDLLGWSANRRDFLGFAHGWGASAAGAYSVFAVPLWAVALAAAVVPVMQLRSRRERRLRHVRGLCHNCGYDLRATPNRCPECGSPAGKSAEGISGGQGG